MGARRARPRLSWTPKWESIERWTRGFVAQNRWRCDSINEDKDLVQDCYLTFLRIAERYPRVNNQRHFFTLYVRAVMNEFHDRARVIQRNRDAQSTIVDTILAEYSHRIFEVTNIGYVNALLAEAPEEYRLALGLLASDPSQLVSEKPTENLNGKLRRILGITGEFDFTGVMRGILRGGT